MLERDFEPFCSMLDDIAAFYPQAKAPTAGQKAIFFRALAEFSIAQVRAGFDAHVKDAQRGRFAPLPADIVAQIEGNAKVDGRPGPEEAWAIAIQAADESRTFVWTNEIAEAWGIARNVFELGDEVGARMSFKDAYARLVTQSRRAGVPAAWVPTIGTDADQRDIALEQAHAAGRLPAPERLRELPSPNHALSGKCAGMPDHIRGRLAAVREQIAARRAHDDEAPGPAAMAGGFNLPELPGVTQ